MVTISFELRLGVVVLAALWAFAAPARGQEMKQAYLRMDASSYEEFTEAINTIEDRGAVIRHRIYPIAAMGVIDESMVPVIGGTPGMVQLFIGKIPSAEMVGLDKREVFLMKAYNNIYFPAGPPRSFSLPEYEPVPIDLAPRSIPEEYIEDMKKPWLGAPEVELPFPEATSEFMLGDIAVALVLPESEPGYGIHDWLMSEEEKTTEEFISAMDWWARHSPNQELTFNLEINYAVPVQIEPMEDGQDSAEGTWAGQSLAYLGYSAGNHFVQARDYVNEMRLRYKADWGFVVFVLHGHPGQQFNGFLAYAYLGGPFNVNVCSNGYVGPDNLDRIIAHESGHTFYTLDEYPVAPVSCSSRCGYLNAENANKQEGGASCKSDVPCVMRGGSQPTPFEILDPCYYTQGQVGWWDEDGDGIPDILDMNPVIHGLELVSAPSGASIDTVFSDVATYRGSVSAVAYPNRNPESFFGNIDFTVEDVSAEYRVDGGPWMPCNPTDGRFDSSTEDFELAVQDLPPEYVHTLDVRAVTAHGNVTPAGAVASAQFVLGYDSPPVTSLSSSPAKPPVSIKFWPVHSSGSVGDLVSVEVAVYDAMGRRIATLEDGEFQIGRFYETSWDGKDSSGRIAAAGVYAIAMSSQGQLRARKVLVIP